MPASKLHTRALPQEFLVPEAPEGYVCEGFVFQAYPPSEHTWPEEVVRAIREDIDPEFCPMGCYYVYRSPAGTIRKEYRHWIWLEQRDRLHAITPYRYQPASQGVNVGRYPNVTLMPLAATPTPEQLEDGVVGDFLPLDWSLYEMMKRARDRWAEHIDPEEYADHVQSKRAEAKAEAKAKMEAESSYRWNQDWHRIKKLAQEGRILDKPAEPKAFLEVRGAR